MVDMADLEIDDALVVQSFLDACMSEQSSELVVQKSIPDRHVERSCSRDAQRCKSSTQQMAVTDDSIIQVFLDMLDREHVAASSLDGQETHVADTPCQAEMPIARDIYVDACFVDLARLAALTNLDAEEMEAIAVEAMEICDIDEMYRKSWSHLKEIKASNKQLFEDCSSQSDPAYLLGCYVT
ncbi:hypothetical protein L7F22_025106 [Adiantum nelumboides]|nr:hypothetical protein [Adiantum nelumboides]